jgi:hypothetical protein
MFASLRQSVTITRKKLEPTIQRSIVQKKNLLVRLFLLGGETNDLLQRTKEQNPLAYTIGLHSTETNPPTLLPIG